MNIDAIPTARAPTSSLGQRGRSLITAPAVAGIAYATAWVLGLAVWPSNLGVAASNVNVLAMYRAHQGAALTQYMLVEGVAAIALAVVVIAPLLLVWVTGAGIALARTHRSRAAA
jgi:hypothetical protein